MLRIKVPLHCPNIILFLRSQHILCQYKLMLPVFCSDPSAEKQKDPCRILFFIVSQQQISSGHRQMFSDGRGLQSYHFQNTVDFFLHIIGTLLSFMWLNFECKGTLSQLVPFIVKVGDQVRLQMLKCNIAAVRDSNKQLCTNLYFV